MSEDSLSIIMYHYVRDLARSRYPLIKARDLTEFRFQLDHIANHYTVVSVAQVIEALSCGESLPKNAAWLTFDDGYLDHFCTVFPLLHERGWEGSFFPPAQSVRDGQLLDVNRIHFILASQPDASVLIEDIRKYIDEHQGLPSIRPFSDYWTELAQPSRLDRSEIVFIKRILQRALPESLRNELASRLFERFVSVDPSAFAAELYMTTDQLQTMIRCGMYVGSHGVTHQWLNHLDSKAQVAEIDASLDFLRELGVPNKNWVMCYPYGEYDKAVVTLLRKRGCAAALTTKATVAKIGIDDPFALPRLDTNDLPFL